ncbi:MAG: Do family serine endopeptidase [Pseudomonadales bacterium]|nr:Do family serine endopeptidase [Pseudomonadales bacterium]MCP5215865.1 Do family serine endopeptidase [Pseudomonadales bacterium]
MNQLLRLVLWPAFAGIIIAVIILRFFPNQLEKLNPTVAVGLNAPLEEASSSVKPSFGPASYAAAVSKATPAVVNIYTTKIVQSKPHPLFDDPFFRQFFGKGNVPKRQRMQSSLGSGVIISADGYVITNNHVVANADEIVVALQDGRESFAKVVGTDPETDIAVLKIDLQELPIITLTSSDEISVGDVVLAIGNPFGVGQTVTMGIVSATGRNQLGLTTFEDFIQTDAAINPGNSGGALINAYGNLIGINTAIFSKSGGSQGIGFAIPSELVEQIMLEIIEHGSVIRGWLGIEVQQLTPALASSFGLEKAFGVLVAGVHRNGPAHQAGLQPGDILLEVDQQPVLNGRAVMNQITQAKPGSKISISVLRNGELKQIEAIIARRAPTGEH